MDRFMNILRFTNVISIKNEYCFRDENIKFVMLPKQNGVNNLGQVAISSLASGL